MTQPEKQIEQRIVQLIQAGDPAFVELAYDHYGASLYGIVRRMVQDEALASDVLQDSFVKIWKKAASYDPQKAKLFTWLMSVVRNTAIDRMRARKNIQAREVQMTDSNVYHVTERSIRPELLDVKEHLGTLQEKYRAVLLALFFDGMTQQEASDALEIPLGTVKSRLKVGLRELRKIYGSEILKMLILIATI